VRTALFLFAAIAAQQASRLLHKSNLNLSDDFVLLMLHVHSEDLAVEIALWSAEWSGACDALAVFSEYEIELGGVEFRPMRQSGRVWVARVIPVACFLIPQPRRPVVGVS
jgi:hypothetical protein